MRKYLVSIVVIGLAGLACLAWNADSRRAIAQSGGGVVSCGPMVSAQSAPVNQGNFATSSGRMILPLELALEPEDPTNLGEVLSPSETKIEAALESPTDIDAKDAPLSEIINGLRSKHKINIELDVPALKEAGVEPDVHVTKHVIGISLRSALNLLLSDLQLKYVIHDEVLLITSPTKAESDEFMTTKVYPVKDLVLVRNQQGAIEVDFQPLQDTIMQTVATKTWQENGGQGTISTFQARGRSLLMVSQTQEVHEQIVDLLSVLRRAGLPKDKVGGEKSGGGKPATDLLLPIRPDPQPMTGGMGGFGGGMGGGTAALGGPMGGGGFF